MTSSINRLKTPGLLVLSAILIAISSCNKDLEQFAETPVEPPSGLALGETLAASADDALFYKILTKANKVPLLNDKTKSFTIFSPSNSAVKTFVTAVSQGAVPPNAPDAVVEGFIATYLSSGLCDTLVSYHILPQKVPVANIPDTFANFAYPTLFNPASALSALARLDAYTSRRANGVWDNNIPVIAPDMMAANGVIHRIAAVSVPPSQLLLQRIATDTTLSFLMAAIIRADSGANLTGTG